MQETSFHSYTLPSFGPGTVPRSTVVARGTDKPVRVLIKNLSAAPAFFSTSDQDLNPVTGPTPGTWQVDGGERDVFVLAPRQQLYAMGAGGGIRISVSISAALPLL